MVPASIRILALTGGGMMARFSTRVLERMQAMRNSSVGEGGPNSSIVSPFDVLAGTSAGALCVAGLLVGKTPEQMSELFDERGEKIFPVRAFSDIRWIFTAKYKRQPLDAAVDFVLDTNANLRMGDIDNRVLAFPAINESTGVPVVFSNVVEEHKNIRLRDAVLASASAPTYFAAHRMEPGGERFVDGGLFANAPDLAAITLARRRYPGIDIGSMHLVSVGTTRTSPASPYDAGHDGAMGLYAWTWRHKARLLKVAMRSQVDHAMDYLPRMGLASFVRIDHELIDDIELDDASAKAKAILVKAADDAVACLGRDRVALEAIVAAR